MEQLSGLLPLILVLVVFWLLIVRPARNRQRDLASVQRSLQPGQKVMTGGGLYATVFAVEDDAVTLEVAPGVLNRYARQAIVRVLEDSTAAPPSESGPGVETEDDGT